MRYLARWKMLDMFEAARFNLADAVSNLWIECLNGIVGLFVWRDAEVRRFETNIRTCILFQGMLG